MTLPSAKCQKRKSIVSTRHSAPRSFRSTGGPRQDRRIFSSPSNRLNCGSQHLRGLERCPALRIAFAARCAVVEGDHLIPSVAIGMPAVAAASIELDTLLREPQE